MQKGDLKVIPGEITTDNRLNDHRAPPPANDQQYCQGITINKAFQLFIRTERLNLSGLLQANAFQFNIVIFMKRALPMNNQKKPYGLPLEACRLNCLLMWD